MLRAAAPPAHMRAMCDMQMELQPAHAQLYCCTLKGAERASQAATYAAGSWPCKRVDSCLPSSPPPLLADEVRLFTVLHPSPDSELRSGVGTTAGGARTAPIGVKVRLVSGGRCC